MRMLVMYPLCSPALFSALRDLMRLVFAHRQQVSLLAQSLTAESQGQLPPGLPTGLSKVRMRSSRPQPQCDECHLMSQLRSLDHCVPEKTCVVQIATN